MTIGITTVTTTIRTNCPNQIHIRNRIEGNNQARRGRKVEDEREKGKK